MATEEKTVNDKNVSGHAPSLWKEYVKAGFVAILLALFIRTFVAQAFKIPSESMLNTLMVGDHLLVNKLVYHFWEPQRGDIIVFQYPMDPTRDFVKRVVGLPGERFEMKENVVYINGKPLNEPYAIYESRPTFHGLGENYGQILVPEGHVFMMGDNRSNSQDSRVWGALDKKLVHGKVFVIHWAWKDNSWDVRWRRLGLLF